MTYPIDVEKFVMFYVLNRPDKKSENFAKELAELLNNAYREGFEAGKKITT